MEEEIVKAKVRGRTYYDIRRIAYQSSHPADYRRYRFSDQVGDGGYVKNLGNRQGHGSNQNYSRDVVQNGRRDGRQRTKGDEKMKLSVAGPLCHPDGNELEKTLPFQNTHYYHHADKEFQSTEVDRFHGLSMGIEIEEVAGYEHEHGPGDAGDSSVQFPGEYRSKGDDKYDQSNYPAHSDI